MITADQIIAHCVGDYILQSHWMANEKTKSSVAAAVHAWVYCFPFELFNPSLAALMVVFGTHFLIDRYRLARYVVWAKNFLGPETWWKLNSEGEWRSANDHVAAIWCEWMDHTGPCPVSDRPHELRYIITMKKARNLDLAECSAFGYAPECPPWLAGWLLFIADNVIHILINGAALKYL